MLTLDRDLIASANARSGGSTSTLWATILFGLTLGITGIAQASITYTFSGDCLVSCGGVSGKISFGDGTLIAGDPYPAPVSFSLDFDGINIDNTTAADFGLFAFPEPAFPGVPTTAVVPSDISTFVADIHTGDQPPGTTGDVIILMADGTWFASGGANCTDTTCTFALSRGPFLQGSGQWSPASSTGSVPEPATLWLLAVAGLVLWARQRNLA
jgi:hypothetical protein